MGRMMMSCSSALPVDVVGAAVVAAAAGLERRSNAIAPESALAFGVAGAVAAVAVAAAAA